MSRFSTLLSGYISSQNVKIASLAAFCQYDRATLYRIVKGQRQPTGLEQVRQFSRFFNLSPTESDELVEAYYEQLYGVESYRSHRNVMDFLLSFSEFINTAPYRLNISVDFTNANPIIDAPCTVLKSSGALTNALIYAFGQEAALPDGEVMIAVQPGARSVFSVLEQVDRSHNLKITHLICLDNTGNRLDANIDALSCTLTTLSKHRNYTCSYYYDDTASRFDDYSLLPYLVITSDMAISFNASGTAGFCYRFPEAVEIFRSFFLKLAASATLLHHRIETIFEEIAFFQARGATSREFHCIDAVPCILAFIPPHILGRVVMEDNPLREDGLKMIAAYLQNIHTLFTKTDSGCYFTQEGLANFARTGRSPEVPSAFYRPLTPTERAQVLRTMLSFVKSGQFRIMKNPLSACSPNFFVDIFEDSLSFTYTDQDSLFISSLSEPGLIGQFMDFFTHLGNYGYLYSNEEAAAIVENQIDALLKMKNA